jgi:carbamoyltransferase
MKKTYLGLNFGLHDSSATVLQLHGGKIRDYQVFSTERLTKVKHAGGFPLQALRLIQARAPELWNEIPPENVAINSNVEHPLRREKKTMQQFPFHSMLIEKAKLEKASLLFNPQMEFVPHHLSHAYSTLTHCPFEEALVVVCDGLGNGMSDFPAGHAELPNQPHGGPWQAETATLYLLRAGKFELLEKVWSRFTPIQGTGLYQSGSLGNLFVVASNRIFGNNDEAGKVMGLAAYGQALHPESVEEAVTYLSTISLPPAKTKTQFDQLSAADFKTRADIAATVQAIFENELRKLVVSARKHHPLVKNLVLVGGCALNCSFNGRIIGDGLFENVFVPPFPNDEGISLGAALALAHKHGEFDFAPPPENQSHAYFGPRCSDTTASLEELRRAFPAFTISKPANLSEGIAAKLAGGEIVAWMQGRPEVGPRSLGARSILMRPDAVAGKDRLNAEVKKREHFRPYGATFLQEHVSEFFDVSAHFSAPYMTVALPVKAHRRAKISEVVHHDGTCRFQTLTPEQNPSYYDVIKKFHQLTGVPALLNTSLNVMGQPILEVLADAVVFMEKTPINALVYGPYLLERQL